MTPDLPADPEILRLLDAMPVPTVRPVDLGAIYRDAIEAQARSTRRWQRAAGLAGLIAAGVLIAAVVPKLEVRASRHEVAVRWGQPDVVSTTTSTSSEMIERAETARQFAVAAHRAKVLEELLLTLAADVDDRDRERKEHIASLQAELTALERYTRASFDESDRSQTALYQAVFEKSRTEGAKP